MSDSRSATQVVMVLEPEHFHAALLFREADPRLADDVHVYTRGDASGFRALLEDFNATRGTRWQVHVHRHDDALGALTADPRGTFAVLAGRNDAKLDRIAALHAARIPVLADKPWLVSPAQRDVLDAVMDRPPLVMDIMTSRHDPLARLRRRIARSSSLFGEMESHDADGPAIEFGATHHLVKQVNGEPLRRPAWYFDVAVQGDGLSDIQAHLVDQVQWLTEVGKLRDYGADIELDKARRWATEVPLPVFTESTGEDAFPDSVHHRVHGDMLALDANGRIDFQLHGVTARTRAEWRLREPEGGGDMMHAIVRGRRAEVILRQSAATDFEPRLTYRPLHDKGLSELLAEALGAWKDDFPGAAIHDGPGGFEVRLPESAAVPHEAQFAAVMRHFLDQLEGDGWSPMLSSDIRLRYTLLGEASQLARDGVGDESTLD